MSISYSVLFNALLSGTAGVVSAGICVVNTASGFAVGTLANRGTSRCAGIALTTSTVAYPVIDVQVCGLIPAAISGLPPGSASWVRVNTTTALLERVATPSGSDDVVGWADPNGDVHSAFGLVSVAMAGIVPSVAVPALALDWSAGNVFTKTLASGANTFTFANSVDGQTIVVIVTGASSTLSWPTVKWTGGTPPTQTASGTDVYTFVKAGSTIYGSVVQALA